MSHVEPEHNRQPEGDEQTQPFPYTKPRTKHMAASIHGLGILRGSPLDNKPTLPEGWTYVEKKDNWLLAQAPNGDQYFVSQDKLFPRRINLKDGTYYLDNSKGVIALKK